ncbi:uncharacterized protein K452DRAFT_321814 [Aplosporella prunicola CBS 121167]|uniref:Dienelactone hydrolase domain-containing protein n=1 Tax=Aplosporella prunicola CBS 121167 TaxID=1176127 RepID=A0A6A6B2A8_9PEZI|nr:uncharacterized protein K452DRAFT_321814 [Aplosporella prunicola CBS 121167]KAF2137395.1 hypothetical protein K452DRAFT_321814 [Aplosporella prunicola CBS 121167]
MSCPDCFGGHVHAGVPKGQVTKLHGIDTYVSQPAEGTPVKGIIVILHDGFGWEFVNNRLLADHYAEKGDYKVYLPDFVNGHVIPVWATDCLRALYRTDSTLTWLLKPFYLARLIYGGLPFMMHSKFPKTWPTVKAFMTAVRENEGASLPIGAAGFCWGGKHTAHLAHGHEAANGKPLIDAAFTGHPSRLQIPEELENVRIPMSFAVGDKDHALKPPQVQQIRDVIEGKPEGERGEVRTYLGASHGFCVRADLVLLDAERQATEAEEQALAWFGTHFGRVSY